MRYCMEFASNAHVECMREVHVGMNEYELEAIFGYQIYRKGGCRNVLILRFVHVVQMVLHYIMVMLVLQMIMF